METKNTDGVKVDTILYTKECNASQEKSKAEVNINDPSREKALGVLQNEDKVEDESEVN